MSNKRIEEILEEYAVESGAANDLALLKQYIKKYPQFADALMDFAASRSIRKFSPAPEMSAEEESSVKRMGRDILGSYLAANEKKNTVEISSIAKSAEAFGMNKTSLASAIGVSVSLLMYFEKRKLKFESIPQVMIKRIAEALKSTEDVVSHYLKFGPVIYPAASFKSESRPSGVEQKAFSDAVAEDQTLTADQKNQLLSMND